MTASKRFYTGVFTISGLLMSLQVIESRIFSVTTWYHLSFLIISMAMFGLTLGALSVHRGDEADQRANYGVKMARACQNFGLSVLVALAAQMLIPVVSDQPGVTLVVLPVMSALTVPPYFFAGIALSLAITRAPFPTARTYGVDLLGAAAGCLFALWLMETVDGPSAMLLLALASFAASRCFGAGGLPKGRFFVFLAAVLLVLNVTAAKPLIYPLWVKGFRIAQSDIDYDRWNSISRVTIHAEKKAAQPYLWGPSPKLPKDMKKDWRELMIDGGAGTPINHWQGDKGKALGFLDYDVTTIAYALPGLKKSGIIGLGGGRDVLSSLHAGVKDITAMDVNAVQVSALTQVEPFKSYAGLSEEKGVKLIHSEARSWFSSHPDEKFDLIQMSLVDTAAATGAGAFTLTENGLYTVEAWKMFLSRLNNGGAMTVSRWFLRDAYAEGERLLSLTMATLFEAGAKEPRKHIFAATSGLIVTLVMSRDPFTGAQLDAMERRAKQMGFDILVSPRKILKGTEFANILNAETRAELDSLAKESGFDIRPPVDARPFFFNQLHVTRPLQVLKLILEKSKSAIHGYAHAVANLYIIILFAAFMVGCTIVFPLRRALSEGNKVFLKEGTAWFFLIGLGFMLMEIALLQRMSVYLGHPAYSLGVLLFSLVLSTGAGSLLSDRFPLSTETARQIWALLTAFVAVLGMALLGKLMVAYADADLMARAILCVCFTLPIGCLLGFGFPTGMALAQRLNPRATAWFWGINGAAGVMGSGLAIALNMAFGLQATMIVGALCYALLSVLRGNKQSP
jgi:hypothetical protein